MFTICSFRQPPEHFPQLPPNTPAKTSPKLHPNRPKTVQQSCKNYPQTCQYKIIPPNPPKNVQKSDKNHPQTCQYKITNNDKVFSFYTCFFLDLAVFLFDVLVVFLDFLEFGQRSCQKPGQKSGHNFPPPTDIQTTECLR